MSRQQQPWWLRDGTMTRREVAALLEKHPDTVSRLLLDGLGCAVIAWGGHGQGMLFGRALVERWHRAVQCRARGYCPLCELALEDCRNVAEHLRDERHGYGGCPECTAPWLSSSPHG